MATHSQNIENLRTAIYGEQVRTSMIQLFEEDYQLVKGGIGIGTDVSSASSPITGYVDGNLYINSDTLDIFKCNGSAWVNVGNLKGIADITTVPSTDDGGANVVTIRLTNGTTKTFNILNGKTGSQGTSVRDAIDNGDGTFNLELTDGTRTPSTITPLKGEKGDKGDKGEKGDTGATGRDVTRISSTDSGKNHIITAEYSDGTSNIVTTIKDGADGSGTGDMSKADYDKDDNGIVDEAEALYDVATHTKIPASTVMNKADKSTTLGGYGITDAYTKAEVISRLNDKVSEPATDGKNGQALVTDGNGNRYWSDAGLSEEDKFTLSKIDSLTMSCQPWRATNYLAGEFVVKDGYIYEAKVNTKSTWDSTEWQLTNLRQINDKLSELDNETTDKDKVLTANGDGTASWKVAKGGHDMYKSISELPKDEDGYIDIPSDDEHVVSAHVITEISNEKTYRVLVDALVTEQGGTGIGTWCADIDNYSASDSVDWIGAREGEEDISNLLKISDHDDDVKVEFLFEADNNEPIYNGGYQLDTTLGRLCIKFGNTITKNNVIGIDITRLTRMK